MFFFPFLPLNVSAHVLLPLLHCSKHKKEQFYPPKTSTQVYLTTHLQSETLQLEIIASVSQLEVTHFGVRRSYVGL